MEEPRDITDEELEGVAARVRSIRRRELRARLIGVAVAVGLAAGLFGATYLVVPAEVDEPGLVRTSSSSDFRRIRIFIAALGFAGGVFVYSRLTPREHPDDVE